MNAMGLEAPPERIPQLTRERAEKMARTREELNVEDVHALVLPGRGVLTSTLRRPSKFISGQEVFENSVRNAGHENAVLGGQT